MLIAAFTSLFHFRLHSSLGQRLERHVFTDRYWANRVEQFEYTCDVKYSLIITTLARSHSTFTQNVDIPPFHDAAGRDQLAKLAVHENCKTLRDDGRFQPGVCL